MASDQRTHVSIRLDTYERLLAEMELLRDRAAADKLLQDRGKRPSKLTMDDVIADLLDYRKLHRERAAKSNRERAAKKRANQSNDHTAKMVLTPSQPTEN